MVRSLCFVLLAVNFFGLVESNNNCVFDKTLYLKAFEERVKLSRGCAKVTTPVVTDIKPSNGVYKCFDAIYTVHVSNREAKYWGTKVCYRKYHVYRGKENISPTPVPEQKCDIDKVTGKWEYIGPIENQNSMTTTITSEFTTATSTGTSEEWSKALTVSASSGFKVGGIGTEVNVEASASETFVKRNEKTFSQTSTVSTELKTVITEEMLGQWQYKFVIISTGKCGGQQLTRTTEFDSVAYANPGEAPCCLPGYFADAKQYTSRICTEDKWKIFGKRDYCGVAGTGESEGDPLEKAKELLKKCNGWTLATLPKTEGDKTWNTIQSSCSLNSAQTGALKDYSFRCQRCPNACQQKDTLTTIGICQQDKKAKLQLPQQMTFGLTPCCCPKGFQTDCTNTLSRTAISGLNDTSTGTEISSAESASKTLFSCSVVVFILHLLL